MSTPLNLAAQDGQACTVLTSGTVVDVPFATNSPVVTSDGTAYKLHFGANRMGTQIIDFGVTASFTPAAAGRFVLYIDSTANMGVVGNGGTDAGLLNPKESVSSIDACTALKNRKWYSLNASNYSVVLNDKTLRESTLIILPIPQ